MFLEREALLIEVNPLFVQPDGSWIAGDAKLVTDDNALARQEALRDLVERARRGLSRTSRASTRTASTTWWWIPRARSGCSRPARDSR